MKSLHTLCNSRKTNNEVISSTQKANDEISERIKGISKNEDIKKMIISNLHIEDNGEPLFNETKCMVSSSDGVNEERVYYSPNFNASFHPDKDEFDIIDCEFKDDMYRIKVECTRRRKYFNAFMWEPDFYWTDWFKI